MQVINLLSPDWSNDLHAPSGDSMCSLLIRAVVFDASMMFTPHTKAALHRPPSIASTAKHRAWRLDEQAVSTFILGPRIRNRNKNNKNHC